MLLDHLPNISGGQLFGATVQQDGMVVATGMASPSDAVVMRFNDTGLDPSFGVGNFRLAPGIVYSDLGDVQVQDVALANDGRIVSAGIMGNNGAMVIRYTGSPTATPDSYATDEDTALHVDAPGVLANDPVPGGSSPVVSLESPPLHAASFTLHADGSFDYLPAPNFNGTDAFSYLYTVNGEEGGAAAVVLNVLPVNDPPSANDDAYTLPRTIPLSLNVPAAQGVLANDQDVDGDILHAILIDPPSTGNLQLNDDGSFIYDFPADFVGSETFTYKVNDGTVDGNTATVTLTRPDEHPPIANPDSYRYPFQSPFNVPAPVGLLWNDQDPDGDALTAELVAPPADGIVTLQPDGSFTFQYPDGLPGPVTFSYRVTDGREVSSPTTVTLTLGTNSPPDSLPDAYDVPFGSLHVGIDRGVLANDSDVDGDPLRALLLSQPNVGHVAFNLDGTFDFTGFPQDFVGSTSFTYKANDGLLDSPVTVVTLTRHVGLDGQIVKVFGSSGADTVRLQPSLTGLLVILDMSTQLMWEMVPGRKLLKGIHVDLGGGDDRADLTGWPLPATVIGGAGNDVIHTGPKNDTIDGDEIDGSGDGSDIIDAGNGNNIIHAGGGDNLITTGKGADVITAGDGRQQIDSGAGNDNITVGVGGSVINAGAGDDFVSVAGGSNWVQGGAGRDVLIGGAGDDALFGEAGNDLLIGGLGVDWLDGGTGNDMLFDGSVSLDSSTDSFAKLLASYRPAKKSALVDIANRIKVGFDDASNDMLFGGNGHDWFWTNDLTEIQDFKAGDLQNAPT